MGLDFNKEIGKKKDIYPSKKSINLCYQTDKSSQVSTVLLRVIFIAVVVLALVKFFVVDVIVERNEAKAAYESIQSTLDQKMALLKDYDAIAEEYSKYSYKVIMDGLEIQDRMDILAMLEETVFVDGTINNVSISGNVVMLSFEGLSLEQCAQLIVDIKAYEMVEGVVVSNQSGYPDGTYDGNLTITLVPKNTEADAGGEQ